MVPVNDTVAIIPEHCKNELCNSWVGPNKNHAWLGNGWADIMPQYFTSHICLAFVVLFGLFFLKKLSRYINCVYIGAEMTPTCTAWRVSVIWDAGMMMSSWCGLHPALPPYRRKGHLTQLLMTQKVFLRKIPKYRLASYLDASECV